ncbi:hypothetical protein LSH36_615g01057 [Paralvinella palmiformis]|uniref:Ras-associating domain-containing protein n=1 Tax=Paralvinella palmiformis TaxID=53620 RepID=A0AAD9J5P7_9ANNE|nr:hypothetical protein LSH36_615g01057 [Paralvinella palmiformis]
MVTMSTTSVTPTKSRLDQQTAKFMAVKVDVSRFTSHSKSKAFVISNKTTSRDLADMVMRKLKVDDNNQKTCLLAEKPGGGKVLLDPDDRVLRYYGNHPRRAPIFELIPADSIDPIMLLTSLNPTSTRDDVDAIKAGNLSTSTRNGMTLPGYKNTDANSNVTVGDGFLTSTPNPECESAASTVDSGLMIHYEPYNGVEDLKRTRSKSFELARDNGCGGGCNRLDLSGNASDSGLMILNGNGPMGAAVEAWPATDLGLRDYPYRPSPQDGFQILQSKNSAWKPFDRHVSDGLLKGITERAHMLGSSVPDVSDRQPIGDGVRKVAVLRRRSLPRMSVSQEELNEKKRSVADLFAVKLRLFLDKSRRPPTEDVDATTKCVEKKSLLLSRIHCRGARDDDDAVSVTSQEVAEILSSASPLKPYEEEEDDVVSVNDDNSPNLKTKPDTPQHVFQPLANASPMSYDESPSPTRRTTSNQPPTIDSLVKESMITLTASNLSPRLQCSDRKPERRITRTDHSGSDPGVPRWIPQRTQSGRGVPLYTLLATHLLAPVMLQRSADTPSHFLGVRLCDVAYVKCVRHVLRHWEATSRQFSVDPKLTDNMLVAVGGIDRRSTFVITGKLFRGDIIVEVNGRTTLQMSAREVIGQMNRSEVVSLVVARSRLNVERAQSP